MSEGYDWLRKKYMYVIWIVEGCDWLRSECMWRNYYILG